MGSGAKYSDAIHRDSMAATKRRYKSNFGYHAKLIEDGKELKVHESLDPSKLNSFGQMTRESRDSQDRPNSHAVAVIFDVTGSQRKIPQVCIEKLPLLMGMLIKEGILEDPHILFGAVGDAKEGDKVPLQIGQFEGSNTIDTVLSHMILEGGGGMSERKESYELAMYFLSQYATMDCLEKRGKKGFLFMIGDELPRDRVNSKEVNKLIGDGLQGDISLANVIAQLEEKFEVFWITTGGTLHWNRKEIIEPISEIFGQHYIRLENPNDICECIAGIIAKMEGFTDEEIKNKFKKLGVDDESANRASAALVPFKGRQIVKVPQGDIIIDTGEDEEIHRVTLH